MADGPDIYGLLNPDDAQAQAAAQARLAALRGQKSIGMLGMVGGGPMAQVGQQMITNADQGKVQLEKMPGTRLKYTMDAAAAKQAAADRANMEAPETTDFFRQYGQTQVPELDTSKLAPSVLRATLPMLEKSHKDELTYQGKRAEIERQTQKDADEEEYQRRMAGAAETNANKQDYTVDPIPNKPGKAIRTNKRTGAADLIDLPLPASAPGAGPDLSPGSKEGTEFDKEAAAMQKDLDAAATSRSPFGQQRMKVNQAKHLMGIVYHGNNLDKRQQGELATGLASILSGSNAPAIETIRMFVPPQTVQSGAEAIAEWVYNEPRGLGQQKFVAKMVDMIQRQEDIGTQLIEQEMVQRLPAHARFRQNYPDHFKNIARNAGLDPDSIGSDFTYRKGGSGPAKSGSGAPPGMVTVKTPPTPDQPNGQVVHIRQANLAAAVAAGAVEVK